MYHSDYLGCLVFCNSAVRQFLFKAIEIAGVWKAKSKGEKKLKIRNKTNQNHHPEYT